MEIFKSTDILKLSVGDTVSKRSLYNLIQYSKIEGSEYWAGECLKINNTPQQGINWIGELQSCLGVIIKTRLGLYEEDGWSDDSKNIYRYSFKAKGGVISYTEKANRVLVNQPQYLYPVLLFSEAGSSWRFEGFFSVEEIEGKYVVLSRELNGPSESTVVYEENQYKEGGRKYVAHLMAERSSKVVKEVKAGAAWVCDMDFYEEYGVQYIEAHHKTPISTYSSMHTVSVSDFSLLCPNCHKAVHIFMSKDDLQYNEIKEILSKSFQ